MLEKYLIGKVAPKNIQELLSNPDFRRVYDKGLNY